MSERRPPNRIRLYGAALLCAVLLYALSVPAMIALHDVGWLPGAWSAPLRWFYAPLHWLLVVLTGRFNG